MTLTPDRQAALLFMSIDDLLDQIPSEADLLGIRSPNPFATHSTPEPGTLPHGLDAVTDDWETGIIRTKTGCLDILTEIADEWAEKLGYQITAPTVDWLGDQTTHAYNILDTDTWDSSMNEARRVWSIATRLAGQDPEPTSFSCPNDGATTLRYPFDDGFTDWMICPRCGTPWTMGNYLTQREKALHDAGPDTLISPKDSPRWGVPSQTVWSWLRRGKLDRQLVNGAVMVRLGDVQGLAQTNVRQQAVNAA